MKLTAKQKEVLKDLLLDLRNSTEIIGEFLDDVEVQQEEGTYEKPDDEFDLGDDYVEVAKEFEESLNNFMTSEENKDLIEKLRCEISLFDYDTTDIVCAGTVDGARYELDEIEVCLSELEDLIG